MAMSPPGMSSHVAVLEGTLSSSSKAPTDLLLCATLLCHQLVKHCPVILVDLLHLIDMAGHFFHGL